MFEVVFVFKFGYLVILCGLFIVVWCVENVQDVFDVFDCMVVAGLVFDVFFGEEFLWVVDSVCFDVL